MFTLGMLIVYRVGTYIPIPGVDAGAMAQLSASRDGGILGMLNSFSGGALGRMTVFALNVMPYITAAIIMQLGGGVFPALAALKKEGGMGRVRLNQYARYLTVLIAGLQGYGLAIGLQVLRSPVGVPAVIDPGVFFEVQAVLSLVGGTMLVMWVGEQITARGIGNGISLIIFSGIVAGLPRGVESFYELVAAGGMSGTDCSAVVAVVGLMLALVIVVERAQRRVIIQYPGKVRFDGAEGSYLPLRLNAAGVMPPIFAGSMLLLPAVLASFSASKGSGCVALVGRLLAPYMSAGSVGYLSLYAVSIIFFTFFYTALVVDVHDFADGLKNGGAFIPGCRPGLATERLLDAVMSRLAVLGSLYLVLICVIPQILVTRFGVPFYLGGTQIIIIVSVSMDLFAQVNSYLFSYGYDGSLQKMTSRDGGGRARPRSAVRRGRPMRVSVEWVDGQFPSSGERGPRVFLRPEAEGFSESVAGAVVGDAVDGVQAG
jgi:preprotein translocase subunit SecY